MSCEENRGGDLVQHNNTRFHCANYSFTVSSLTGQLQGQLWSSGETDCRGYLCWWLVNWEVLSQQRVVGRGA